MITCNDIFSNIYNYVLLYTKFWHAISGRDGGAGRTFALPLLVVHTGNDKIIEL